MTTHGAFKRGPLGRSSVAADRQNNCENNRERLDAALAVGVHLAPALAGVVAAWPNYAIQSSVKWFK